MKTAASLILLFASLGARAQVSNKTTTNGSCSPIVTGGSSQININCTGISPAQAKQMVSLMNRILAEHLDLSQVNLKLDQLHEDVSGIHSDIHGLSQVMDPLGNAPESVLTLIRREGVLESKCRNIMDEWNQRDIDAAQSFTASLSKPGNMQSAQREMMSEQAKTLSEELAKAHLLMPQMISIRDEMVKEVPDYASGVDYDPKTRTQLVRVCMDLLQLRYAYQNKVGNDLKSKTNGLK